MSLETPPDLRERDLIASDLDTTMLVEAAAGTGKTTSLIARMVALLAEGKAPIETLAAVTFTRKAAAELRSRFQIELEKAFRNAKTPARERLAAALSGIERCFIGTIHSFCARLLRERPVEAGVDVSFDELDETRDMLLRQTAWNGYVARLYSEDDPILRELEDLGIEIGELGDTFMRFADYPDVEEWPARTVELPDLRPVRNALKRLVDHMENLLPHLPLNVGKDKLIEKYKLISRMYRQSRTDNVVELMEILAQFSEAKTIAKNWPGRKVQAQEEQDRWDQFRMEYAEPTARVWLEHRYEPCLRAIKPAIRHYDLLKLAHGALNYQDLLMLSAHLLRDHPKVREYFRKRFTHLLVDEFQDTDPIQAEVILLLTASDLHETDWHACRPVNGSLFVVGDPKQSIYRFRRADIVTYNQVKSVIKESGGKIISLSANFRSLRPVVEWVNSVFRNEFPAEASDYSPQYVALTSVLDQRANADFRGVRPLILSGDSNFREYEAELIARTIRRALNNRLTVPRSPKELAEGIEPVANPGDFLIITPKKANLSIYARKLEEMEIPYQVTGGGASNQVDELSLLHTCLVAASQPDNPVSLVAALRSELFGVSDAALYRFKRSGGDFSFTSKVPKGLEPEDDEAFKDAFEKLIRYSGWLMRMPVVPAIERILADTGLYVRASLGSGGNVRAGSLAKSVELLREEQTEMWTASQVIDFLGDLILRGEDHDSMPAGAHEPAMVRVMNLHKAKGLEAPVVFLADPTPFSKDRNPSTDLHVDRSGPKVCGYLQICDPGWSKGARTPIAQAPQWDKFVEKELLFLKAEKVRLLYVAATRAGVELIISQRKKGQHHNPWRFFESRLADLPPIIDPGPQRVAPADRIQVTRHDVSTALAAIRERWEAVSEETYRISGVKALAAAAPPDYYTGIEHGTEWGTVIHMILQVAMTDKNADLTAVARDALAEQNLDIVLADEAVEAAQSVINSEIWKRASSARSVLVEVPFETIWYEGSTEPYPYPLTSSEEALKPSPLAGEGGEWRNEDRSTEDQSSVRGITGTRPILLRGVIDLVFLEPKGWVIVDYKTDRQGPDRTQELVERYRRQVVTYVEAWEKMTGEPVHEAGLYFTYTGAYTELDIRE